MSSNDPAEMSASGTPTPVPSVTGDAQGSATAQPPKAPSLGTFKIPKLKPVTAGTEGPLSSDAPSEEQKEASKTAKRRRQRARKVAKAKAEGHRAPGQEKKKAGGTKYVLEFPRDVKKWTTMANFRFATHYVKCLLKD